MDRHRPNYATGQAQPLIALVLTGRPHLHIARKTGFFAAATGTDAVNDGVLTGYQAVAGHSLAPDFMRGQLARNREQHWESRRLRPPVRHRRPARHHRPPPHPPYRRSLAPTRCDRRALGRPNIRRRPS
ncbi:hypothetical protein [Streptomyces sp. WELS2]|uniref:hypothetical protein n=1 Tax=Streptomyces sp. WELS2 TaxID=2749435 RepID=UPI0015F018B4|nr:hypothetical protein [Streptomyces sp. WELS2]